MTAARAADDPLRAVLVALHRRRPPDFAWTIEWSTGGRDPVAAAWERSYTPSTVGHVAGALLPPATALRALVAVVTAALEPHGADLGFGDREAAVPALLRVAASLAPGALPADVPVLRDGLWELQRELRERKQNLTGRAYHYLHAYRLVANAALQDNHWERGRTYGDACASAAIAAGDEVVVTGLRAVVAPPTLADLEAALAR